MCDEYDEERMAVFWRRLEQIEGRKQVASESEENVDPLVRIEPVIEPPSKTRARPLTR